MTNRRFEWFEYRHVIVHRRLMGRNKLAVFRQEAESRGWLDPANPMPDDAGIAGVFSQIPRQVVRTCVSSVEPFREQIRNWPLAYRARRFTLPSSAIMATPAATLRRGA